MTDTPNENDTSADAVERLIAPIRDHLERAEEENARLQYIKATIRVNGMRHGATEDQILKMQTGGMSFIQWMVERLDYSALAAERDALQAKLDEAVKVVDAEKKEAQKNLNELKSEGALFGQAGSVWTGRLVAAENISATLAKPRHTGE